MERVALLKSCFVERGVHLWVKLPSAAALQREAVLARLSLDGKWTKDRRTKLKEVNVLRLLGVIRQTSKKYDIAINTLSPLIAPIYPSDQAVKRSRNSLQAPKQLVFCSAKGGACCVS